MTKLTRTLLTPYSVVGSILFLSFMAVLTIVYSFFCLLCYRLPYKARCFVIMLWMQVILWLALIFCGIRHQVEGKENIPSQAVIILSAHQSTWETFFLPLLFNHPAIILKQELLKMPFFGWGLRLLEPIAINRRNKSSAMQQVLTQGAERLERGQSVLIFPQGSRVPVGRVAKFKLGGAILAANTGYPVVPVALNSGLYWARGKWLKKPGKVTVSVGPMIETKGHSAKEIMAEAKAWIEAKEVEILPKNIIRKRDQQAALMTAKQGEE